MRIIMTKNYDEKSKAAANINAAQFTLKRRELKSFCALQLGQMNR